MTFESNIAVNSLEHILTTSLSLLFKSKTKDFVKKNHAEAIKSQLFVLLAPENETPN